MTSTTTARRAATASAVGLAALAAFQILLAAGAPLGEAAWGGSHAGQLPAGLRVGSGLSIVVYAVAVAVVLRRGGFPIAWVPSVVARAGTWVLVVLLTLGALANLASASPWERFLLGPVTLVLAVLCFVVARSATVTGTPGSDKPVLRSGPRR